MEPTNQTYHEAPEAAATPASAIIAFLLGVTGIPGIIMGHIALARIKNSQRRLNGKFFAVIGIVTGWLSLAIMCICAIGIAVGIAALPASWTASHEMKNEAALQTAKSLQVGLENYYKKYESYPISEGDKMRSGPKLVSILTGHESTTEKLNPQNVQFFESKKAEHNWLGIPVDGLDQDGEAVSLYDPWGKRYHIKLNEIGMKPTVWSSGRDGIDGTTDDILLAQ